MRPAIHVVRLSSALLLVAGAIAVTTGCAPVAYRVPGIEVQRLARLDPLSRGAEVRVVPRTAAIMPAVSRPPAPPLSPSPSPPPPPSDAHDQVPPPPVAIDDEPGDEPVVESARPFDTTANVVVDVPVDVRLRGGGYVRPVHVAPAYPVRPMTAPHPTPTTVGGGAWRGSPVASPVRPSPGGATFGGGHAPAPHFSGGHASGHHGGGGSGATAAVVGVVAVVGLVAAIAIAADHAERVEVAHSYDGWVAVAPSHPVHLHYGGNLVRVVALSDLRMDDTIGLQYAVLRASEGEIQHLRRAPGPLPR